MKPIKEILGNLAYMPVVGNRAVIYSKDTSLWTSTVVDVRYHTADGVEIETLNTIYKLKYDNREELPYAV